jgi:hypothetical protein
VWKQETPPNNGESVGVYNLAGLRLDERNSEAGHISALAWSKTDTKLKKGAVMKVVSQ